ncbi:MAG: hypothetical protein K2M20_09790 [Lachnospiraceae bacterium]|nr:hypothetical protein [Lachnospiraceae bacterium]
MREEVRIYNWDGKKYRFLGRVRLRKENDTYVARLRERMGERSFTTRYLLFASAKLVRKNRYENLLFCAGGNEVWLPVEERMYAEVLFSYSIGNGDSVEPLRRMPFFAGTDEGASKSGKEGTHGHNQCVHDREK